MPQTDINLFFNQVFVLILVFFLLLVFFSKSFLKTLSYNLFFRQNTLFRFSQWHHFFQEYSSNVATLNKIAIYDFFHKCFSELTKTAIFSANLLNFFLSSEDAVNFTPLKNNFESLISDYSLKTLLDANSN